MSGGGGFIGDIVGGVGDVVGGVLDTAGDVVGGVADVVGDVAKNIDIKDAALTYILTGNPIAAAVASTSIDEKLGFNPAAFYNPDTGGFGFDNWGSESTSMEPYISGGGIGGGYGDGNIAIDWNKAASSAINTLANYAANRPEESQQLGQTGQNVLSSMSSILADVAAGKYSKSPASEYNTRSVLQSYYNGADNSLSAGLLNDYGNAKKKVAEMIESPSSIFGEVALQGNPFYNFMKERNIGQSRQPLQGLFKPYLEKKGII